MALNQAKASRMALYASDAENLFTTLTTSKPPNAGGVPVLDVEATAPITMLNRTDWSIAGQLRCDDDLNLFQFLRRIFGAAENNFFYGFLLERLTEDPSGDFAFGDFLAVVRGTVEPVEWMLDIIAAPDLISKIVHPVAGFVPSGFSSIYDSMTLVASDGRPLGPAARAIGDIVNRNDKKVTVVGHSLGAALASYLILDLVDEVSGTDNLDGFMIACPQPGDDAFAAAFRKKVANYNVVNWERDLVPKVPPFPFRALLNGSPTQNVVTLEPGMPGLGPPPPNDVLENHHAVNYALMLNPGNAAARAAVDWQPDGSYAAAPPTGAVPMAELPQASPAAQSRSNVAGPGA